MNLMQARHHPIKPSAAGSKMARVAGFLAAAWLLAQPGTAIHAQENKKPDSSGSGFVVSSEGHVVTAYHVVANKEFVVVGPIPGKKWARAKVVLVDETLDLALLKTEYVGFGEPLPIAQWSDVPIGLEVFAIGYPRPRVQGLSRKITQGIVNGDRSESGNADFFQFSAGIQKGSSGGPLLAPDGSVIGVALRKLGTGNANKPSQDLPQNVNYGLKSAKLIGFLNSSGIKFGVQPLQLNENKRPHQIYRQAALSVVAVLSGGKPGTENDEPRD